MYYVYLLRSIKYRKIYIGITDDVPTRLQEHNRGESQWTSYFRPWKLIYYEAYSDPRDAQIRERRLKYHGKALGQLKRRLTHCLS